MSDEQTPILTKEEKLVKLQELGISGNDQKAVILLGLSHVEFDYLIEFNSNKPEAKQEEPTETVSKEKYDTELIKRRDYESKIGTIKKSVRALAEQLVTLSSGK